MKVFVSLILVVASALPVYSQKFYTVAEVVPTFVEERYLDADFDWNIDEQIQLQLREGLALMKEKKFNLASCNFSEVIDLNPKFWPALYYRGICNRKQGKLNDAEKDLLKASRIIPKSSEVY